MRIRDERSADRRRVFRVHEEAFGRRDEAQLVDVLRRVARPRLSLVAEDAGGVVGHVLFTPVAIGSPGAPPAAGLAPIAVDPARQGRGVGAALVREGLRRCPGQGWRAVFLVGDPAWYARFGFAPAGPAGFRYGDPHSDAALQGLALAPDALAGHRGRVRFHGAFGQEDEAGR